MFILLLKKHFLSPEIRKVALTASIHVTCNFHFSWLLNISFFFFTSPASERQILIISYHSSQLDSINSSPASFHSYCVRCPSDFLRGKTQQITSLQNILYLLLKFTGLSSNLLGEFASILGFFACFSCSISSDLQNTISDQWYCSFYIFILSLWHSFPITSSLKYNWWRTQ